MTRSDGRRRRWRARGHTMTLPTVGDPDDGFRDGLPPKRLPLRFRLNGIVIIIISKTSRHLQKRRRRKQIGSR